MTLGRLAPLWLIGVAALAAVIAVVTAQVRGYDRPGDVSFLIVATVAAAAVAFLAPPVRRWTVRASVLTATVVAIAIGARDAVAMVAFAGLMAMSYAVGARLLRVLTSERAVGASGGGLPVAAALGLGAISNGTLALALAGLLRADLITALIAATIVLLRAELLELWRWVGAGSAGGAAAVQRSGPAAAAAVLVAAWAAVVLLVAAAPEIQYDALWYHLALPRVYVEDGRLTPTPEILQSWTYLGTDLLYTAAMLLGGQLAAKLVAFMALPLTAASIFAIGRQLRSARAGGVGAGIYVAAPIVAWQATTTYTDAFVAFYCLTALAALVRWRAARRAGWAAAAGACAGLAVATKLTAFLLAAPLALGALALSRTERRSQLLLVGGGLLAVAPWPVLRFLQTGNPVFPFFNDVFRSALLPSAGVAHTIPGSGIQLDWAGIGIGRDPAALLALPLAMTFDAVRFVEAMYGSVIGMALLIAPVALVTSRSREILALLGLAAASTLLWAETVQHLRYYLPMLGVLSVIAGIVLEDVRRLATARLRPLVAALPFVLAVAGAPAFFGTLWNVPDRIPWRVAIGLETREAYLDRALPTYAALQPLAGRADVRVVLLSSAGGTGDDDNFLYAPRVFWTVNTPFVQALLRAADEPAALALLNERGVTHLAVNRGSAAGGIDTAVVARREFLTANGVLERQSGPVELYRLGR